MSAPREQAAEDPGPAERVAVIAVHGVADQKSGDTARAIAALMVNAGGAQARYSEGDCDSFILAVPPLAPMVKGTRAPAARPALKSLRQSARSDFQRRGWTSAPAAQGADTAHAGRPAPLPGPAAARMVEADAGTAFSDYLLMKAAEHDAPEETYEATRVRMTRQAADGRVQQVDVHEMYWADLSRLSGAIPRIVTEVFTMVFRLSRLARDTVDDSGRAAREDGGAPAAARRWRWLTTLQIGIDWAFCCVLANLFLQLLLAGLVIAGLGVAAKQPEPIRAVLAWALPALAVWWFCYRHVRGAGLALVAIAVGGAAVWLLLRVPAHWVIGLAWLALLTLACDYGLRVAAARFPAARGAGLVLLAVTLVVVLGHVAADALAMGAATRLDSWVRAGIRAVEWLLVLMAIWWAVAALLLAALVVAGQLVAREGAAARASVATGRLGLFVSMASFMILTMTLWALATRLVELGAGDIRYPPLFFTSDGTDLPTAADFLRKRYENSTHAFALAAGLTLLLLVYLVVMLVPSILAEVKAAMGTSHTLGRWLSGGYRNLDWCVTVLVYVSAVMACVVGAVLLGARFGVDPPGWLARVSTRVGSLSETFLQPLVFSAATSAAVLSAFGALISRYAPWLRAPLDVALDVDNHFREFPRRAIPRARIFSRYAALLEHVAAQGYDRVVVVAHSQGTVISTELLRYLQQRAWQQSHASVDDRVTRLWDKLEGRLQLLTAGCPLRQLYAARFPHRYQWVLWARDGLSGPAAADVGVQRWINVYTTGDYVGRWLWCDAPPAVDTVRGEDTLYEAAPAPVQVAGLREADVCLGTGAHTHYFEAGEKRVAECIDALVGDDELGEIATGEARAAAMEKAAGRVH